MRFLIDEMFPPRTCAHLTQRGMDAHLASVLDQWAATRPEPYVGLHWPKTER